MDDKVPDTIEFEEQSSNAIDLDALPHESDQNISEDELRNSIYKISDPAEKAHNESEILLNLTEPPSSLMYDRAEDMSNDMINEYAEKFIEPIVSEAVKQTEELIRAESPNKSDSPKLEGFGDKKSEKSSSDDGFEHIKAEDNDSSVHQHDESFLHEDLMNLSDHRESSILTEEHQAAAADRNSPIDHFEPTEKTYTEEVEKKLPNVDETVEEEEESKNPIESLLTFETQEVEQEYESDKSVEEVKSENEDLKADTSMEADVVEVEELQVVCDIKEKVLANFKPLENFEEDDECVGSQPNEHETDIIEAQSISPGEIKCSDLQEDSSEEEESKIEPPAVVEEEFVKQEKVKSELQSAIGQYIEEKSYVEETQEVPHEVEPSEQVTISSESPKKCAASDTTVISNKLQNLVTWKHPIVTGVVFGVSLLMQLALILDYSVISLTAYVGILILISSVGCKIASRFHLLKTCPFSNSCSSMDFNGDDIQYIVKKSLDGLELLINEIKAIAFVVSFSKNLKAFTFFWILTYVGCWFNLSSLIFIGTILLFSLPLVYKTYEKEINKILSEIKAAVGDKLEQARTKINGVLGRR